MTNKFNLNIAGGKLTISAGQIANNANGAVFLKFNDTVLLSAVTASKEVKKDANFFPLSVEYSERMYSKGKIPKGGSRREGKPTDEEILVARLIDRPIRPLFPKDFQNEVNISNLLLSQDSQLPNSKVPAIIATSTALAISDIPFDEPIGAVEIGLIDGEIIINPSKSQSKKSELSLILAGTKDRIMSIEASGKQIPDDIIYEAISQGHEEIKKIVSFINNIKVEIGKEKFNYKSVSVPERTYDFIKQIFEKKMIASTMIKDKQEMKATIDSMKQEYKNIIKDQDFCDEKTFAMAIDLLQKEIIRNKLLYDNKRIDGRELNQIRPLSAQVGLLPSVHGSAIFQRGDTQSLSTITLEPLHEKHRGTNFIHHYNFPAFSTGELKPNRGPSRREIGHGYLAQKAIEPVLPDTKDFPYLIRGVSEILMSNGSSSQASIVGSTLALMDAGVPIKEPVAGIAAGLISNTKNPNDYVTFIDMQGIEDHLGDMDFKVAGTKNGITAIQMDTKINGITMDMVRSALNETKKAREKIIDGLILKTLPEPVEKLSPLVKNVSPIKRDFLGMRTLKTSKNFSNILASEKNLLSKCRNFGCEL